eukprot:Opistho-1_new@99122
MAEAANLQKHLAERPPPEELLEKNILKANVDVSPAIVAKQDEFRQAQRRASLEAKIAHRPDVQELTRVNILHGDGHSAPAIQATQDKLKMRRLSDAIEDHLESRPPPEMVPKRILEGDGH